jgi:hypothetical protein
MNRIKYTLLSLGIIAGFGLAILPVTASAVNVFEACPAGSNNAICSDATNGAQLGAFVTIIVDTLLYILGAVAVIVIILSGISYVTSTGDPAAITRAKSTLTYGVIGLVVALLAYAIVNYVIGIFVPVAK